MVVFRVRALVEGSIVTLLTLLVSSGSSAPLRLTDSSPSKKLKLRHVQPFMNTERTTFVVQKYLDELAGAEAGSDAELVISALLGRAAKRTHRRAALRLCRD